MVDVATAPAMADAGRISGLIAAKPKYIATTAPKPAEDVTPVTPGSASGLRNSPCNAAPLAPNAPPTTSASNARGKRISRAMIVAVP